MTSHLRKHSNGSVFAWLYDRFLELFIYPSIWVAAAIASLGIYAQIILKLDFSWQPVALIFFTALIPYNLDRIIDSYVQKIPDNKAQLFFRQPYVWALLIVAIALSAFLLYYAPQQVRYVSIAGIVPLLYGTPILPWRQKSQWRWYRLKDIPGSKAWIVGATLTYAVIALPLAYASKQFDLATALVTLFMFVFIVTNSHVFDIRDVESDRQKGVVTLPIMTGIKGTKIILAGMNLLALLIMIIAWNTNTLDYHPEIVFATILNLIYIAKVNIDTPRWVYNILIEGCLFVPIIVSRAINSIF